MHEEVTAARHECFPILFVHSIVVRRNFFAASQNVIGAYRTNQRELDEAGRFRFTTTMQQYVTKTTLQQYVTKTTLQQYVTKTTLQQYVTKTTLQQYVTKTTVQQYVTKTTLQQYVTKTTVQQYVTKTTLQQYVTKTTLQQYVTDTRLSPFVHSCGNGRVAVPVRTVANGWRHFIVQPC